MGRAKSVVLLPPSPLIIPLHAVFSSLLSLSGEGRETQQWFLLKLFSNPFPYTFSHISRNFPIAPPRNLLEKFMSPTLYINQEPSLSGTARYKASIAKHRIANQRRKSYCHNDIQSNWGFKSQDKKTETEGKNLE